VETKPSSADISSRAVDELEWDEIILAIADELTELGRKRLAYEVFASRLESEVRELTGLRGLVSDDFVSDLLSRAQTLLRASDFPPAEDPWFGVDDEPIEEEIPRQRTRSGLHCKIEFEPQRALRQKTG
jgi:hypothetical protein